MSLKKGALIVLLIFLVAFILIPLGPHIWRGITYEPPSYECEFTTFDGSVTDIKLVMDAEECDTWRQALSGIDLRRQVEDSLGESGE